MRRAAVILGLVAALTACSRSAPDSAPEPVPTTPTLTKRLSKTPPTTAPPSGLGDPVVVPDPANHKACRILDWNDLPADVRPAPGDLSNHVTFTNDEEFCRIDNSEFVISPEANGAPDIHFFKVMALVSDTLVPIEKYLDEAGRMITIGGHEAVEIVGTGEPPGCQIVVAPFAILVTNNRFPQYDPCELARSLTEAILRRTG